VQTIEQGIDIKELLQGLFWDTRQILFVLGCILYSAIAAFFGITCYPN